MRGIQFQFCHSVAPNRVIAVTIDEDSNLEEVETAFKAFLLACGYPVVDVEIT